MRALVVDDELTTRLVLEDLLARYAEVDCCTGGAEAVEAARRALENGDPYELICLDIFMPGMTGIEALARIRQDEERHGRERPRGAKVIMTTASGDTDTADRAFHEFCDAYVLKPIDAAELLNVIECLCPLAERS
jgi:two-component system, chemotaxis family, chemotaxis protein CheY